MKTAARLIGVRRLGCGSHTIQLMNGALLIELDVKLLLDYFNTYFATAAACVSWPRRR